MKFRIGLFVLFFSVFLSNQLFADEGYQQGLVGAWYEGDDLTRVGTAIKQTSFDVVIDALSGHGNDWSAQWVGFVTAPVTGYVTFYVDCNKEFIVEVAGENLIHIGEGNKKSSGSVEMEKGKKSPITVKYLQHTGGEAYFRVFWSWAGEDKQIVSPKAMSFTDEQAKRWNYVEKPDASYDFGKLRTIPVANYFAFSEPGRFGGWPANNGVLDMG